MARTITTATILMISAIIIVALTMGWGISFGHDYLGKISDAILQSMGIYHITIHNEKQFRGLIQCIAAAHYHFEFKSINKMTEMTFKDLDGTEMEGCTIKGKVPHKINIDFKINNNKGYIVLGSGKLEPHKIGEIEVPSLDIKGKDVEGHKGSRIMPIAEDVGCVPITKNIWLGYTHGWATLIKGGDVEKTSSESVPCAGSKKTLNLASIKVYDGAKAQINVIRDRNVDVYMHIFPDLKLDDVLILKMKITDKGIKKS